MTHLNEPHGHTVAGLNEHTHIVMFKLRIESYFSAFH